MMHITSTSGSSWLRLTRYFALGFAVWTPTASGDPILYVSDSMQTVVRAFDVATETHSFDTDSLLVSLSGLAIGPGGDLYAAGDNGLGPGVFRYDATSDLFESYVKFIGTPGGDPHDVSNPQGMAFSLTGNLYVADITAHDIHVYGSTDDSLARLTSMDMTQPTDVAFDSAGNMFAVSAGLVSGASGGNAPVLSLVSPGTGGLTNPTRITVGPDGKLYVLDTAGPAIRRYKLDGLSWVSDGDFVSYEMSFFNPADLEFGPDGKLYVVGDDSVEGQVLRYLSDGMLDPDFLISTGLNFPAYMTFSAIPEVSSAALMAAAGGLAIAAQLFRRSWKAAKRNVNRLANT